MTIKLKPCPFCGGKAVIAENWHGYFISCSKCHASTDSYTEKEELVAFWNDRTRTAEHTTPDRLSGLKPCPMCGSYETFLGENSWAHFWVSCLSGDNCYITIEGKATKQEAIDAWNRRTPDD